MPAGFTPLVVDNGSTDGSGAVAEALGARVVDRGGPRLRRRLLGRPEAATDEVVCFMDADGSIDPQDLPAVAGPGGRRPGRPDARGPPGRARAPGPSTPAWPTGRSWPRCAGAPGWHCATSGRCGPPVAQALVALDLRDRRSGWPLEMVLKAHRAGWRIEEVPVPYRPRTGRSKVTGTVRGTAQAVGDMSALLR